MGPSLGTTSPAVDIPCGGRQIHKSQLAFSSPSTPHLRFAKAKLPQRPSSISHPNQKKNEQFAETQTPLRGNRHGRHRPWSPSRPRPRPLLPRYLPLSNFDSSVLISLFFRVYDSSFQFDLISGCCCYSFIYFGYELRIMSEFEFTGTNSCQIQLEKFELGFCSIENA